MIFFFGPLHGPFQWRSFSVFQPSSQSFDSMNGGPKTDKYMVIYSLNKNKFIIWNVWMIVKGCFFLQPSVLSPIKHPKTTGLEPHVSFVHKIWAERSTSQLPWPSWIFWGSRCQPERCGHTKTAIIFFSAESPHDLAIKWLIYRVLRNAEDFWNSIRSFKLRDNSFGDVERFSGGLDTASEIIYHYHPKLCLQMISSGSGTLFWQAPALKQETNVTALLERCKKKTSSAVLPSF